MTSTRNDPPDKHPAISRLALLKPAQQEAERLSAVRRLKLLDMPPEPEFDELTGFAAALCEVPISIISLIDERREWYISSLGVPHRELPLELTFCQYTVAQDDMLVVEDTLLDQRFAAHPAVACDDGVRFYAGISIHNHDGHPVGTLCVADTAPRVLSPQQRRALRTLAHQTNARFALREQRMVLEQALASTREANAKLAASEQAVRLYQHELEAANRRLQQMATTDPLTGLLNRRAFLERLTVEFPEARRHPQPLSVLLIDVDNFKQWNDQYGHDTGDEILRRLAEVLTASVRANDVVARYGGEEFVLLLPNSDEEAAMALCERVLAAIRGAAWPRGPVTASLGCASLHPGMTEGTSLVTFADQALYMAKRTGKDRVVHWNSLESRELVLLA